MPAMDSLLSWAGMDPATYFNVSLVFLLRSCRQVSQPAEDEYETIDSDAASDGELSMSSPLNDLVSWLLGGEGAAEGDSGSGMFSVWEEDDDCEDLIHSSVTGSLSAVKVFVGALLTVVLASLISCLVWKKLSSYQKKNTAATSTVTEATVTEMMHNDAQNEKQSEVNNVGDEIQFQGPERAVDTDSVPVSLGVGAKPSVPVYIPLANMNQSPESFSFVSTPDSAQFLSSTVDHLQAQLDWILGLAADESSFTHEHTSSTTASLITPKPLRKRLTRRPRWQTMSSLPLGAGNVSPDDKMAVRMWQKLEDMERKMNWKQLDIGDLDISTVEDSRLSAVLQFYQQVCPVRPEQWNASCLIVNYVLTLLEQELCTYNSDKSPLKILEFHSFGSASNKTCNARANRFDVMLVMQVPFCSEMSVYHSEVCDEIPAGKLALGLKESPSTAGSGRASSHLLQRDRVGESFGTFLSVREVIKTTQRLISNAVDRLKLRNKALLDRLSFSLQLAQYDDLVLGINTKMLSGLGLGLSEISLRLTPALRVSPLESNPLPPVFAVPPWIPNRDSADASRGRIQSRIMRNRSQGVPPDLLWQLNSSELAKSFMASAESKLSSAGISGCQVMCQQILRALFSRSGKDTLLTTGEIHPHVLDSVVCFLLLESPPSSWGMSCLPDRLSDCVHFLRSAVQSAWMPGFMIHNPHLVNQMPALKLLPLLTASRQENILANVGPDAIDNILSFMESRLQETGLRRCLKEDYSTEMWEYEFFIFG